MSKATKYPHVAARVFDVPLLIEQSKLITILDALGQRLDFDVRIEGAGPEEIGYAMPENHLNGMLQTSTEFDYQDEGHLVGNGVAVVPVIGTLVQRSDWMTDTSGMLSYSRIERMVMAAMNDPKVREIVMEYDSPGGEVAGAFDLADRLVALRGQGKKITAVASEFAASAAYLLAATADEIAVPRTGMVGSIGVVAAHYDYSKAMDKRGIAVTFVYAGDKKVEGNPYQPLSDAAKKDWQDETNRIYGMFVESVAKNRGMTAEDVRGTQAGMFAGPKAVEVGLATRTNTFSNELSNAILRARNPGYAGQFFGLHNTKGSEQMNNVKEMEEKARAEAEAKAKADADAKAKADAEAKARADAAAKDQGDAVTAERKRAAAILALPEAKGREQMAQVAVSQGMSLEAAKEMLAAAPKASKLDAAMEQLGAPGVKSEEVAAQAATKINGPGIYAKRAATAQRLRDLG